jgi:uncharacterized protein YndB with AHSA1/START domain
MAGETVSATTIIDAPAEAVFAVLADPPGTPGSTAPAGSASPWTASR